MTYCHYGDIPSVLRKQLNMTVELFLMNQNFTLLSAIFSGLGHFKMSPLLWFISLSSYEIPSQLDWKPTIVPFFFVQNFHFI